jgi:hypothetical protein
MNRICSNRCKRFHSAREVLERENIIMLSGAKC